MVYLLANTISGSGSIEANGEDGFSTPANGNDAPGGAGGGGTVVITANSLSGISVNADGGEGGNQNISNREAEGPGGGGGGGYIAIAGGSIATSAQGGANGTTNSPALTEFPANGATAGANGVSNAAAPLDGVNLPSCAAVISTDYGDAPVSYDDTAGGGTIDASDNPAEHAIASTLYLGSTVPDDETAPQSSVAASADDNAGTDDEDGINIFPTLNAGSTSYALDVTVNNTTTNPANVYGWIDFDLDGEFDGDERAASATVAANSTNATVTLNWPSIGGAGADISAGDSYLRLRVATEDLDVTSETTGRDDASVGSASNGEVEDYQVAIAAAAPPTPPTGPTCVSPSTTPFNTVPYTLNTEIQNSLPLSFYNGSMTFDATLNGTATFAGTDGIQVQTDGSFDDHIFVQPTNLPNYLAGTNNATYVFSFPTAVEDFSMVAGGLNNSDGTTISAEFQGSPVPIDATNFSNLSAGMTLRDADGD
ncbi:MAG: GEVED domain-containing protein, partial [Cyanobacteria bacterium J06648_11]